jgi:hypothetical protein
MKRRIRSSPGLSCSAAARAASIALLAALGIGAAACSSDLFHDTKWPSRCDVEPDAAFCPEDAGGAGGGAATSTGATLLMTASASTG